MCHGGPRYSIRGSFLGERLKTFESNRQFEIARSFTVRPYVLSTNASAKTLQVADDPKFMAKVFSQFGLHDGLILALEALKIQKPTEIQARAIPEIMNGSNVVIAAETGSGKTLGFLLPVLHKLKEQELAGYERGAQRPRALVLVPNRELCTQVLSVAKQLSHFAKVRAISVSGGTPFKLQNAALQSVHDILIATPGRLLQHREKGTVFFSEVQYVVIDEVDTMVDEGFLEDLKKILVPIWSNSKPVQFICASATVSNAVKELLADRFPTAKIVHSSNLHLTVPTLKQVFVETNYGEKQAKLLEVMKSTKQKGKSMIFCNTIDSCRALDHYLNECGFSVACYHGGIPPQRRQELFQSFKDGGCSYLVCTDIAARGLDTSDVGHIIMFDFPLNQSDYLHRAGRTARAGAAGMVTSLVTKKDRDLAKTIKVRRFFVSSVKN